MEVLILGYVIYFFLSLLFRGRRSSGVLACGHYGCSLNIPINKSHLNKLKSLGLFNDSRGGDGCGYYNGEKLLKGVDKEAEFLDFFLNGNVELPANGSTMFIGHNRKATYGVKSVANTHPFLIGEEGGKQIIFAHNGTLREWIALCDKYEVDHKGIFVDSVALGTILNKVGPKVLAEYKGAAVLAIHKLDEPNKMYLFNGASKHVASDTGVYYERELYYLKVKEGIYYSSIRKSLEFIWDKEQDPDGVIDNVPHNRIVTLKNGKMTVGKDYINRDDVNLPVVWTKPVQAQLPLPSENAGQGTANLSKIPENWVDVREETPPPGANEADDDTVFYWQGRHWRNKEADTVLLHGEFFISKDNKIVPNKDEGRRTDKFFFWAGVLMRDEDSYKLVNSAWEKDCILGKDLRDKDKCFAKVISDFSRHPVTLLGCEHSKTEVARKIWWFNGRFAKDDFTPKFSNRNYHFTNNGVLIRISSSDKADKVFIVGKESKPEQEETEYPAQVLEMAKKFRVIYESTEECYISLSGIPLQAWMLFGQDCLGSVMSIRNNKQATISYLDQLIVVAVRDKCTLEEVMDRSCQNIEEYLNDALDEGTAFEEVEAEEVDDVVSAVNFDEEPWEIPKKKDEVNMFVGEELLEEIDQKELDEWREEEEAVELIKPILKDLAKLNKVCDDLQMRSNSDLSLDTAHELGVHIDALRNAFLDVFKKHKNVELVSLVKQSMSVY